MRIPYVWGATPDEITAPYPCDDAFENPEAWYRAVSVKADTATTFRRLCQLRVAPYSYDLLDNRGRRSPRELTPGLGRPTVGQHYMTIFQLTDFVRDDHLTMRLDDPASLRVFGPLAITYAVRTNGAGQSRLIVKIALPKSKDNPLVRARKYALAWGDLVMMRKQLHTLAALAERDAHSPTPVVDDTQNA